MVVHSIFADPKRGYVCARGRVPSLDLNLTGLARTAAEDHEQLFGDPLSNQISGTSAAHNEACSF